MSATTTLAPSRAKASAAARPIPFAAPVTNATFPAKHPLSFVMAIVYSLMNADFLSEARELLPVLVVADLFHPIDVLAFKRFGDRDVCHGRRRCCAVPMLLARRKRDDIARPHFLDRSAPALHPSKAG